MDKAINYVEYSASWPVFFKTVIGIIFFGALIGIITEPYIGILLSGFMLMGWQTARNIILYKMKSNK